MENPTSTILIAIGSLIYGLARSVKDLFVNVFLSGTSLSVFGICVLSLLGVLFGFMIFKIIFNIIRRKK